MANKKINQLVSKTAILSTDIFGIGDATTGQLFKKTIAELQAAIGGAVISVNGLVGTVVLDTDDIQELATPTNKYFTDARARGAISLTVTGNSGASTYSSGTGVLNVPTYTLAGLGGISATFLSGTSGISYNSTTGVISYSGTVYTDASIRALLSGSTGISYNSSTGAISYSGTVYTDASVRALISITTTGTSGASTYNNTTGVINVPNYTLAGLGGISYTSLSGGTGITYNNTTGAISYSGTVYTDASVRALISASGAVSYNNTTGVISLTGGNLTEATSSVLTITGGTGAVLGSGTSIQVKQATTSVSGFLSSTDWTTFNNKQATITLTTTGTSGNATFSSNTLNIPQYQAVLTNPVTGTGTSGYHAKWTSSSAIGNGLIYDNGSNVIGIGVTTKAWDASFTALQLGQSGCIWANTTGYGIQFGGNAFFDGSSYKYIVSDYATRYIQSSGVHNWFSAPSGTAGNSITFTERMRITSDGNVGIGNVGEAATRLYVTGVDSTSSNYALTLRNTNGNELIFARNDGLIYLKGNVLINTFTNNGENLYVSGTIRATSTITANSDIRLKSNITKIENALEKVGQISGYTYNTTYDDKRHGGVIAQEMEKVFPEIVNTGNDGLMGVEYGNISALLIEAIKEQNIKIKNLETLLASK